MVTGKMALQDNGFSSRVTKIKAICCEKNDRRERKIYGSFNYQIRIKKTRIV